MSTLTKPILYNGYKIDENIEVKNRIEKILFTEIYMLSDNNFLYLFTDLDKSKIVSTQKKRNIISLDVNGTKYIGVIRPIYSSEDVSKVKDDLTTVKGFDCVAGMKELKTLLINDVVSPLLYPEKFLKYKLTVPNGILLFGPPGCGKTFIVKNLADEVDYNYIELKHSDIGSPFIHETVAKIAKTFEIAKIKAPSIVFIDEISGLVPKRDNITSTMMYKEEEVNEFLMQLDQASKSKILVIGATNYPGKIDSAILRSGRMDKRIYVPPPDSIARREIFKIHLEGRPCEEGIDFDKLSKLTDFFVSSDIELIVNEAARSALKQNKQISQDIISTIIKGFNPSINKEEIAYYEQFKNLERW